MGNVLVLPSYLPGMQSPPQGPIVADFQQTRSHNEREPQYLKQQNTASSIQPQVVPEIPQPAQKDSSKMTWTEEKAQEPGVAVTSSSCIDPHNTSKYIPPWFTPVGTVFECTCDGRHYHDEHNDFTLEIPPGAIPKGQVITIDIGVGLYRPFMYPDGLRPVSPVFWVCIRNRRLFQFLKPVEVIVPHFLNIGTHDDIESLDLTFLKAVHELNPEQVYQFQRTKGGVIFEPLKKYGILQTTHFCSLCISSRISPTTIQKAMFSVYAAIPHTISLRRPSYVYFFVTFFLKTCHQTLKKQISQMPELHNHISKTQNFQFSEDCMNPTLGIVLPDESSVPGWKFGLQFATEVGWYNTYTENES